VIHHSHSPAETETIAADLAARLSPGQCIALYGGLGAGKTQFVRGLVRGLDGPDRSVSSPTYVLLNVYPGGRLTVYHLDAYRIRGSADFQDIGFPELLDQAGLVVVEWADKVLDLLPSSRIDVRLDTIGPDERTIEISPAHTAPRPPL
jgi:tRNA threonylcarbamoyladenosine biosynthesis protein TsaE